MYETLDFTDSFPKGNIQDNLLVNSPANYPAGYLNAREASINQPVNPALNPQIPTLQQQASQAMGLNTQLPQVNAYPTGTPSPQPQVNAYPTGTPSPQPQQPKSYATRYAELLDTLGIKSPQVDMQRAEKLKKQAQWNSIGSLLSTLFSGYMGSKGAPILNTTNEYVPAAINEYERLLSQDKENRYKDALMRLNYIGQGVQQDIAADQRAKERQFQWDINRWEKDQQYRNNVALAALQHGYNLEEINYKNKAELEQFGQKLEGEINLQKIRNEGALNEINTQQKWQAKRENDERTWKSDFYGKYGGKPGVAPGIKTPAASTYKLNPKTHVQINSGGKTYNLNAEQVSALIAGYDALRNGTEHPDWRPSVSTSGNGFGIFYNKAGQADLQSVARTSQEIFDKLQKHNPEYLQRVIGNVSNAVSLPGESEESWNSANVVR